MTAPSEARVTQRAEEVAEEIVSAANIVTNGGYYEIDIDAVSVAVARFEAEVTQSATAPLIEVIEAAREALIWADLKIRSFPHADQSDVERIREEEARLTAALAAHRGEG